jgi:hypothetical protein
MLYTHTDVDSNWKILQDLVMKTPYMYNISSLFLYLRHFYIFDETQVRKSLKICVEKSSLIICNCHLFRCLDVYGISFMTDRKSCF